MLTFEELLGLWNDEATRSTMTAEQLAELSGHLQERARELLDGERTDEVLAELEQIAVSVEAIDEAQSVLASQAEADEARAADLASRIFGQDEGGEGDDGEADDAAPEPEEADDEEAVVPAEGDEPAAEIEVVDVVEPIAAAAAEVAYRPRITRVAARRPAAANPRPARSASTLVASANMGGTIQAGQPLDTPEALSEAFMSAYDASKGYRGGPMKVSVARSGGDPLSLYGEDRYLDDNARGNARKIEALCSPAAITAAGGVCVSPGVNYDLPILTGTDARPVRDDMMQRFGADRAGVISYPPPILTDLTGAVSDWSLENDEIPGSDGPATKPCLTMTCPDPATDYVGAIVTCLRVGNFRSRFFGEQVQAWQDLAAVWQARHAERLLLTAIGAGSTQVSVGQVLGTSRDILTALDRLVPQTQSRHRLPTSYRFRWAAPFWLRNQWRADIARQMPVGTVDETLAFADASIDRELAVRGINVTWFLDGETGQEFGPQGDGPITGWPSTVISYLYPEGTWQFLDGGMFDFGIMRDTTTTATNDFQIFAETLEGSHFHGVESFRISHDVCPDGSASALVDIAPCATGS